MEGIICDTPRGRIFVAKDSSISSALTACGFDPAKIRISRKSVELVLDKPLIEQPLPPGVITVKIDNGKK